MHFKIRVCFYVYIWTKSGATVKLDPTRKKNRPLTKITPTKMITFLFLLFKISSILPFQLSNPCLELKKYSFKKMGNRQFIHSQFIHVHFIHVIPFIVISFIRKWKPCYSIHCYSIHSYFIHMKNSVNPFMPHFIHFYFVHDYFIHSLCNYFLIKTQY